MGTNAPGKVNKSLEQWQTALKLGIRFRNMYGLSKDWGKHKTMLRGIWPKAMVPVNLIHAIGRALIPQIYFRSPRVAVHPKRPGYGPHAWVIESIDNYFITELNMKKQLKSMILDCYLCGRGPGIHGYDSEFGFNPSFATEDFKDETVTSFGNKGNKIEYNYNVKPGMPWFMRCNPMDFIVPWGTKDFDEAPWFAFRKMRTLRDIKEDPKYKNKATLKAPYKSKLEGSQEAIPDGQRRIPEEDPATSWVELWQIHDKRSGKVFVVTLDHPQYLRNETDFLQIEGLPGQVMGFNEDPDYFWWPSDTRIIEPRQLEINDIRTMARKHRRVAILKMLVDKNMLKKEEAAKILDGDVKALIRVDPGVTGNVRNAVALLQSHVPPDLTIAAREVREDVREEVGFSRNQMGAFEAPSGRRTAHEVETVRAASMIRVDERRDIVADVLSDAVRTMNQTVFSRWTEERVADIVGKDGAKYWVRFTGPELKGEFHYKVNPEESLPEDRRTRRQEVMEFIQVASKAPGVDQEYLLKQWARQYEWLDPKMLFPSQGPGRSPEKAMLFNDFMRMSSKGQSSFPALGA